MKRTPVVSSNITSVGYDEVGKLLEVEFKDGGVYQYQNVPADINAEFMTSASLGKYFHTNIKKSYEFHRADLSVTEEPKEEEKQEEVPPEASPEDIARFTRPELRVIRERAIVLSNVPGINVLWFEAYILLATAVDRLDAMIARTEEKETLTTVVGDADVAPEAGAEDLEPAGGVSQETHRND